MRQFFYCPTLRWNGQLRILRILRILYLLLCVKLRHTDKYPVFAVFIEFPVITVSAAPHKPASLIGYTGPQAANGITADATKKTAYAFYRINRFAITQKSQASAFSSAFSAVSSTALYALTSSKLLRISSSSCLTKRLTTKITTKLTMNPGRISYM